MTPEPDMTPKLEPASHNWLLGFAGLVVIFVGFSGLLLFVIFPPN